MDNIVNSYPYNAYQNPSINAPQFISKTLKTSLYNQQKDPTRYGYPYVYRKIPYDAEDFNQRRDDGTLHGGDGTEG